MGYYEHINNLPKDLYDIHCSCWDDTGRPKHDRPYQVAIGKLCEVSDDWCEFKSNCVKLFYDQKNVSEFDLDLAWHCYIKGMRVLAAHLERVFDDRRRNH